MEVITCVLFLLRRFLCSNLFFGVVNYGLISVAVILAVRHAFHITRLTKLYGSRIDGKVRRFTSSCKCILVSFTESRIEIDLFILPLLHFWNESIREVLVKEFVNQFLLLIAKT